MYYLDVLSRCLLLTPFFWCDKNPHMMSMQTQFAQDLTLSLVLFFCFYFSGGKKSFISARIWKTLVSLCYESACSMGLRFCNPSFSLQDAEREPEKTWSPIVEIHYGGGTYRGRFQEGVPEGKVKSDHMFYPTYLANPTILPC